MDNARREAIFDMMLWTDRNGNLIFDRDQIWLCDKCPPCECKPRVLAKWLLKPGTNWDLTPYKVKGFAGYARYRRKWQIRECSVGRRYQKGDIASDGTLLDLPDIFGARYSYDGYMNLQLCCIRKRPDGIELIEPPCNVW